MIEWPGHWLEVIETMRYEIVGNALRVTPDYYSEVQHSPAVWLPLTNQLAQRILTHQTLNVLSFQEWKALYRQLDAQLPTTTCRNLGLRPAGHVGPCGFCDVCEIKQALE